MSKKKAEKKEFKKAVDQAAASKAKWGIILFAVSSTSIAIATSLIVLERLLDRVSTCGDWSNVDWGMDDTELI